jgi:elongation factor G
MSDVPAQLIEIAVEAKADQERLYQVLARLAADDQSFSVAIDRQSGQIAIKGASESDLGIAVDRAQRALNIEVNVGAPQVSFRETITRSIEIDHTHKKQTGGSGQYARVTLRFEPAKPDEGYTFENEIVGGSVPGEYISGVARGLDDAREVGVMAGFPVIDFKARLIDGAYHDVDSSVLAFEIAAREAFREAIPKAAPRLLEPVMKVEVIAPGQYMADVVASLRGRRGVVTDTVGCDARVITATVSLANMLGYTQALEMLSRGRATFAMRFSHYASVTRPDDTPFRPAMGMRA